MARLVDDLLTLARSETDDIRFEEVPARPRRDRGARRLREARDPRTRRAASGSSAAIDGRSHRRWRPAAHEAGADDRARQRGEVLRARARSCGWKHQPTTAAAAARDVRNTYGESMMTSCRASSTASIAAAMPPTLASAGSGLGLAIAALDGREAGRRHRARARRKPTAIEVVIRFPLAEAPRARSLASRAGAAVDRLACRRADADDQESCSSKTIRGSRASCGAGWRRKAMSSTSPRTVARRWRSRARIAYPLDHPRPHAARPRRPRRLPRAARSRQRQHDPDADRQGRPAGQARRARQAAPTTI